MLGGVVEEESGEQQLMGYAQQNLFGMVKVSTSLVVKEVYILHLSKDCMTIATSTLLDLTPRDDSNQYTARLYDAPLNHDNKNPYTTQPYAAQPYTTDNVFL